MLSACGSSNETKTIGSEQVEKQIANGLLKSSSVPVAVSCPSGIEQKVGYSFNCTAKLEAGVYTMSVKVTNSDGSVRYESHQPFVVLDTKKVASAIVASVAKERKLKATVKCPKYVLQSQGVTFVCQATVPGKGTYPFTVTQTDGSGHVKYVGH